MKRLLTACSGLMALFLGGCAGLGGEQSAQPPEVPEGSLQVHIDVPPAWSPWLADDLSEALFNRVRHIFKRHGFAPELTEIRRLHEPLPDRPLLQLRLFQWQVDRSGNVRCVIRASLTDARGEETQLGVYTATEFTWGSRDRWQLAGNFRDAADDIAGQLWRDLVDKNLLPIESSDESYTAS